MSTKGFSEETYSDEGVTAEEAAANNKRKQMKKAKNQKRRARKKLKDKLRKDNACFRCGTEFCMGCSQGKDCPNHPVTGLDACNCQVCNTCFIRNFVGNATRTGGNWSVACPGGCGHIYNVGESAAGYCWRSIGDLAAKFL